MTGAGGSSTRHERTRARPSWGRGHDFALGGFVLVLLLAAPLLRGTSGSGEADVRRADGTRRRIDVNRAEWYEWMLLDEIGEARAHAIIEYRRRHGPFATLDELAAVPGLPRGWIERSKDHLAISRETRDGEANR